jgi:hypothetical protein
MQLGLIYVNPGVMRVVAGTYELGYELMCSLTFLFSHLACSALLSRR